METTLIKRKSGVSTSDHLEFKDDFWNAYEQDKKNPQPAAQMESLGLKQLTGADDTSGGFFKSLRLRMRDPNITNPYLQSPWVYAAIRAIATNISAVPFKIFTEVNDKKEIVTESKIKIKGVTRTLRKTIKRWNKKKFFDTDFFNKRKNLTVPYLKQRGIEVVEQGELFELFRDINPMLSRFQFWEAIIINLKCKGEAFVVLEGKDGPIEQGETPKEMWVFGPKGWRPIVDPETKLISKWKFKFQTTLEETERGTVTKEGGTDEITFKPHQIIRLYEYNPEQPIRGLSPLVAALSDIRQDFKSSVFNEAFFDNGAEPGGVLTTKGNLTRDQKKDLKEGWDSKHKGVTKGGRVAVLEGGLEYSSIASNHKEMRFIELKKWSREVVTAVLKVPKAEITIYEDINYATAIAADKGFWLKTLLPLMHYFEDVFESHLFAVVEKNKFFGAFDLSVVEALREDLQQKSVIANALQRLGYTPNMINERLEMGMPELPWGDVWWAPLNIVPISSSESFADLEEEEETDNEETTDEEVIEEEGFKIGKATGKRRKLKPTTVEEHAKETSVKQGKLKFWEDYIRKVNNPNEKVFTKEYKKYLFKLRNEQLALFDEETGITAASISATNGLRIPSNDKEIVQKLSEKDVERILFPEKEWNIKLRGTTRPLYQGITEDSLSQLEAELGGLFQSELANDEMLSFLNKKEIKVTKINATTREELKKAMGVGIAAGEGLADIRQRIKNVFNRSASPGRLSTIARTETAQTASGVRNIAMGQEGIKKVEWVTAGDEQVREDHATLGGIGPQEINHNFGDDIGAGLLEYPSDINGPPEQVINCRCVLVASST